MPSQTRRQTSRSNFHAGFSTVPLHRARSLRRSVISTGATLHVSTRVSANTRLANPVVTTMHLKTSTSLRFDLYCHMETSWKFQSTRSCSRIVWFNGFLIINRSRSTEPRESNFVLSVPPDILSTGTSEGEVSVLEGENATLSCKASGRPTPRVLWRREKSGFILMRGLHDPLIPGKILHFYLDSSTLATVVPDDK